MARPVSIQTSTILEAARKIFMRDGYKASTVRIAREAGVSEGSLFKHFKNKCNLFLAAMEVHSGEAAWDARLLASAGKDDIRDTLEATGIHLLQQLRLILPRLMMVSSSGVTIPKHDDPGERPSPLHKTDILCRYFEAEVAAKRLAMANPQIQAHAFLGALSHYAWCETMFGYRSAPPETYVCDVVDTILKAAQVAPRRTTRTTKTSKKK